MVSAMSYETTGLSMANSDYFILGALQRLNWERCTYEDIVKASEVKCNISTVWRSLDRLQRRGVIEQVSRSKMGCVYQLKDNSENA
jgi:Fe2+ or Zn2+ uptake regulation protein